MQLLMIHSRLPTPFVFCLFFSFFCSHSSVQSPWSQFFRDSELLDTIKLDLSRTYSDSTFFQSEATQKMMLHILFVWSKLNAETSYRQGMNELLAPLMFVLASDAVPASYVTAESRRFYSHPSFFPIKSAPFFFSTQTRQSLQYCLQC